MSASALHRTIRLRRDTLERLAYLEAECDATAEARWRVGPIRCGAYAFVLQQAFLVGPVHSQLVASCDAWQRAGWCAELVEVRSAWDFVVQRSCRTTIRIVSNHKPHRANGRECRQ